MYSKHTISLYACLDNI